MSTGMDHHTLAQAVWSAIQALSMHQIAHGLPLVEVAYAGPIRQALWLGVEAAEAGGREIRPMTSPEIYDNPQLQSNDDTYIPPELGLEVSAKVRGRILLLRDIGLLCWGSRARGWGPTLEGLARFLRNARELVNWAYSPALSIEQRLSKVEHLDLLIEEVEVLLRVPEEDAPDPNINDTDTEGGEG